MRYVAMLGLLIVGCGVRADGDVQMVAIGGSPITLTTATATVDAWLLDNCSGSTETLLVTDEIDLLATQTQPQTIPGGAWCGVGVQFAPGDSLHLEGTTASGTAFVIDLDPGLVVLAAEYEVDGDEWVLVLDGDLLLDPELIDPLGPDAAIRTEDPEAETILAGLKDALWFGPVWQARDEVYVDLWPFPDITFEIGFGDINIGGCNYYGGVDARDLDGDGLVGAADEDDDGDGLFDVDDPDRDGDDVDDVGDADGGSGGSTTGDGNGGSGGGGGASAGCGGTGGSSGCDCQGSSGGSDGCGGADCGGSSACATMGFGPPGAWVLAAVLLARRRRSPGGV